VSGGCHNTVTEFEERLNTKVKRQEKIEILEEKNCQESI